MIAARDRLDRGAVALGGLIVVAANLLYLTGLPLILDPAPDMDPLYIEMAQHPIGHILTSDPAWGPLYALWFKPFVAMLGDPVAAYTANIYALSIAVTGLIYCYIVVLTGRAAWGVAAACLFLIADLNVPLAGKVSDFALLLVLIGLTASELVATASQRATVVAAGVLLAAYARPEFYPAALCLLAEAFWRARAEAFPSRRAALVWPAALLIAMLGAAVWMGTPVLGRAQGGSRLLAAFQEHFAWNWSQWHNRPEYFLAVWEEEFGAAHSLLQAVWNNPGAAAHHVGQNFLGSIGFLAGSAFDHYPVLTPATSTTAAKAESLLTSAALLGLLGAAVVRRAWRRQLVDRYGHVLFTYAILAAVPIASAIVIFPLARYLVVPAVLLLLMATLAATIIVSEPAVRSWPARLALALLCVAAIPRPFVLPSAYGVPDAPFKGRITVARPIAETIAFIRHLGLPQPVQVLTFTDGIGELLGPGFHEIKAWQKGQRSLEEYIRTNDIAVIVTLERGTDSFVVRDPYWTLIQSTPEAAGFTQVPVPGQDVARVYVRTSVLHRE
jgi:hypothetical protein